MALFTKSIQEKKIKKDGVRICVMRRPGKYNDKDFDIWMPVLSPSHELLDDIHAKKIIWNQYVKRFTKEVLIEQKRFLTLLIDIALKDDVTILCWEKSPEKCHRRLIAEECKKINPELKVIIK